MNSDSSLQSHKVMVAGERFQVKTDADADTLLRVASYVEEKMHDSLRSSGGDSNGRRQWILLAMNIAGELFDLRRQLDNLESTSHLAEEKTEDLLRVLEELSLEE